MLSAIGPFSETDQCNFGMIKNVSPLSILCGSIVSHVGRIFW